MDNALSKLEKVNYPLNDNLDNVEDYFNKIFNIFIINTIINEQRRKES